MHRPEKITAKLLDADAMLYAGQDLAVPLQALEVSESTLDRRRAQYGGMKCEEAKRLKHLEDENRRLKQLVADQALDIQMLKHLSEGNW
jgi:putative transposase